MATSTKTNKRNWRQWMTDAGYSEGEIDDLATPSLTREGVLHYAHGLGAPITDRMLRQWEAAGALPGPERKWWPPERAVMAFYPRFMPQLVKIANDLHRMDRHPIGALGPLVAERITEAVEQSRVGGEVLFMDTPEAHRQIVPALRDYAIRMGQYIGVEPGRIVVTIEDKAGRPIGSFIDTIPST